MNCMKCGVELKDSGVFCAKCLEDMENYPVKPNITVHLPVRPAVAPVKRKRRRQKYEKPEEQIRHLKNQLHWLFLTLVVTMVAFGLTAAMLIRILHARDEGFQIGQNYDTIETTDPT